MSKKLTEEIKTNIIAYIIKNDMLDDFIEYGWMNSGLEFTVNERWVPTKYQRDMNKAKDWVQRIHTYVKLGEFNLEKFIHDNPEKLI